MKRLTTAEFIAKARAIHGDKYDYSKVEYINAHTKVCIICPEHGEFWMTPNNHLNGKGCKMCTKGVVWDTESFISQAQYVHKGAWDYRDTVYTKGSDKVAIRCAVHGTFWMLPHNHLRGYGCPECGRAKNIAGVKAHFRKQRPDLSHIEVPEGSKAVPVGTKGDYALVDEEDYDRVMEHNWCLCSKRGYVGSRINGKIVLMHRFIMNPPDDMEVDHIFHNTLDNRKSQLRVCNRQQNCQNTRGVAGTSTFKGVYWSTFYKKWVSSIIHNGIYIHVGYFTDEVEAARAYDIKVRELRGDFAYTNFKT